MVLGIIWFLLGSWSVSYNGRSARYDSTSSWKTQDGGIIIFGASNDNDTSTEYIDKNYNLIESYELKYPSRYTIC